MGLCQHFQTDPVASSPSPNATPATYSLLLLQDQAAQENKVREDIPRCERGVNGWMV